MALMLIWFSFEFLPESQGDHQNVWAPHEELAKPLTDVSELPYWKVRISFAEVLRHDFGIKFVTPALQKFSFYAKLGVTTDSLLVPTPPTAR